MISSVEAFPLAWPDGTPRARFTKKASFKSVSLAVARDGLLHELRLLGASNVIISTNIKLRNDGLPYSNQAQPVDRGVAIYFKWKGAPRSMACDKWNTVEDNLHALELSIGAMRGLDRWGSTDILQKVFHGFVALPSPGKQWWEILDIMRSARMEFVEEQYRRMAKKYHPDNGGTAAKMAELNKAIADARAERQQ